MSPKDREFVKIAYQLGYLNKHQVSQCLQMQNAYLQQNKSIQISQLLIQKNFLSAQQISTIAKHMGDRSSNLPTDTEINKKQEQTTVRKNIPAGLNTTRRIDKAQMRPNLTGRFTADTLNPSKSPKIIFGRYQIVSELGRGGMGIVYQAHDLSLNRSVAIKLINKEISTHQEYTKRFEREAQLMAKLKHPGIIEIYDFGYQNQQNFLTMEYVKGEDLEKLIERQVPVTQLIKIFVEVVEAIQYAHQNGVIHRDLKPSNILVDTNSRPRVLDFGLAKEVGAQDKLSQSGQLIGTLKYMSPEQANGNIREIDAQSDVYSLGAILYCILLGRAPFSGINSGDIIRQILSKEPVRPTTIHLKISKKLEAICLKALEKDKSDRYQSAQEMAIDLRNYLEGKEVKAKNITWVSQSRKWLKKHRVVSFLSMLVAISFVGLWIAFSIQISRNNSNLKDINQQLNETNQRFAKLNEELKLQKNLAQQKHYESQLNLAQSKMIMAKMHAGEFKNFQAAREENLQSRAILTGMMQNLQKDKDFIDTQSIYQKSRNFLDFSRNFLNYQIRPSLVTEHQKMSFPKEFFFCPVHNASWQYLALYPMKSPNTILLWSHQENKVIFEIPLSGNVGQVSFDKKDRYLAVGSVKGHLRILDIEQKILSKEIALFRKVEPLKRYIRGLHFSSDNSQLLVSSERDVMILGVPNLKRHKAFPNYGSQYSTSSCFSPDDKYIMMAGTSLNSHLWNKQNLEKPELLDVTQAVCFSPNSEKLAFAVKEDVVIWDLETNDRTTLKNGHKVDIRSLHWSPDGNFIASVAWDGNVILWDVFNGKKVIVIPTVTTVAQFVCVRFHPKESLVAVWTPFHFVTYNYKTIKDKQIDFEHYATQYFKSDTYERIISKLPKKQLYATNIGLAISKRYAAFFVVYHLFLWDLATGTPHFLGKTEMFLGDDLRQMTFSRDGKKLLLQGRIYVHIWDVEKRELIYKEKKQTRDVLNFHPNNQWAVVSNPKENKLQLWKIDNTGLSFHKDLDIGSKNHVAKIEFNHDGSLMIVVEGIVDIYKMTPDGKTTKILSPNIMAKAACFSYSDKLVAVGDTAGNFSLWDIEQKQRLCKLSIDDPIEGLVFSEEQELFWILTAKSTFLYKIDPEQPQQKNPLYPLVFSTGHAAVRKEVIPETGRFVVMTPNFSIVSFNTSLQPLKGQE